MLNLPCSEEFSTTVPEQHNTVNTGAERQRESETESENKTSSLGGLTEHASALCNVQTLQTLYNPTFWILKIGALIVSQITYCVSNHLPR